MLMAACAVKLKGSFSIITPSSMDTTPRSDGKSNQRESGLLLSEDF